MATWSKNNLAHRRTYLSLRILVETKRKFSSAGPQEIRKLDFWVEGDSANMRKTKARSLATRLNNLFIDAFESKFESGYSAVKSINTMTKILIVGDKAIQDLAEVADTCYDFFGEKLQ